MTPFVGQIQTFGFNFAPRGWAFCNGDLLSISNNTALFSLLGTIYGGDGRTTFGLPDLRGRIPLHQGTGPGLRPRQIGEKSGWETVMLATENMPAHNHTAAVSGDVKQPVGSAAGNTDSPSGTYLTTTESDFYVDAPAAGEFAGALLNNLTVAVGNTGNGAAFEILEPALAINYCIALQGIYPSRP